MRHAVLKLKNWKDLRFYLQGLKRAGYREKYVLYFVKYNEMGEVIKTVKVFDLQYIEVIKN
jgi:hypothetical protein